MKLDEFAYGAELVRPCANIVLNTIKVYMQGKMKNFKFRNLERNDLP
jgi:hypothetical protein